MRQRRYLVECVTLPPLPNQATLVDLSCLDDDAQGEPLSVLWEHELDARVLKDDGWSAVAEKGFDDPALFAAYLRTLSLNCVTATDPNLFQAPFRAGIRIDAYQLDPLRKALKLPRVNLFIAVVHVAQVSQQFELGLSDESLLFTALSTLTFVIQQRIQSFSEGQIAIPPHPSIGGPRCPPLPSNCH